MVIYYRNPIVAGWLLASDGGVSGDSRLTVSSDGSLVIRNVSLSDAVSHTCRAFNTIGSATRNYTVIVQSKLFSSSESLVTAAI